jgi:hypothetical protein
MRPFGQFGHQLRMRLDDRLVGNDFAGRTPQEAVVDDFVDACGSLFVHFDRMASAGHD